MNRIILVTAATLAIVGAVPALAADLPQAPPPPQAPVAYVPTVAPVYNWGGIYFGANAGYGFGSTAWTESVRRRRDRQFQYFRRVGRWHTWRQLSIRRFCVRHRGRFRWLLDRRQRQ